MISDQYIIEKDLCTIFSPEWLRNTAHNTGLVKRERKIDPVIMFWVLIMLCTGVSTYLAQNPAQRRRHARTATAQGRSVKRGVRHLGSSSQHPRARTVAAQARSSNPRAVPATAEAGCAAPRRYRSVFRLASGQETGYPTGAKEMQG
jgi:hypothetical protein